jgi:hypothetical protein
MEGWRDGWIRVNVNDKPFEFSGHVSLCLVRMKIR